jgi:hypothetical protein
VRSAGLLARSLRSVARLGVDSRRGIVAMINRLGLIVGVLLERNIVIVVILGNTDEDFIEMANVAKERVDIGVMIVVDLLDTDAVVNKGGRNG